MVEPPAHKPMRYSAYVLEMACQLEDNGMPPILNPRDVTVRSLFLADSEWMRDKSLWRGWVKFYYDLLRPDTPNK